MTGEGFERALERELERCRAISDPEIQFGETQDALRLIEKFNSLFAGVRGGASLGLKAQGWSLDRIGKRFGIEKSSVQRIVDQALGRPKRPRKRGSKGSADGAK